MISIKKTTLCTLFIYFFINLLVKPIYGNTDDKILHIGTLPTTSSLLLYVAVDEGIFKSYGLDVEIVPFRSTIELTSAMRAGALDGHFTDIITALIQNETGIPQKIIVNTLCSTPHSRNFAMTVPQNSSIKKMEDLRHHTIAISNATIIEFLLTQFLKKTNIPITDCNIVNINRLIVRMQMLLMNKIDSALLVEPLISLVEVKGGYTIIDDHDLDIVLAVIALTQKNAIPEVAEPFRNGIIEAASRIKAEPQKYQKFMVKKGLIPKELIDTFPIPVYGIEKRTIPTPEDIEVFVSWMLDKKYIHTRPQYKDVVLQ